MFNAKSYDFSQETIVSYQLYVYEYLEMHTHLKASYRWLLYFMLLLGNTSSVN